MKKLVIFVMLVACLSYIAAVPMSNLKMWLKADDINISDGGYLSQWNDASGNGNNVTASGSTRPLYVANSNINGQSAVRFQGGDDALVLHGSTDFDFTSATIFVVRTNGSGSLLPIAQEGTTYNDEYLMAFGTPRIYHHTRGGVYYYLDHQINPSAAYVETAVMGNAPTDNALYVNSVGSTLSQGNSNGSSVANYAATNRYVTVGNRGTGSNGFTGDIAEVLVYEGKLSNSDRLQVEQYLGGKYLVEGYDPIPEPGSFLLLLAGVFFLFPGWKKMNKK